MKTLLVAINAKYIHTNAAVYSLQKSAAAYEKRLSLSVGDIAVREFGINQSIESIYYEILAEKPDVVAFSVYIWNVEMVKKLCSDLKAAKPGLRIWLGGPEVSFGLAGKGIDEATYDAVMEGEGERVFYYLLARVAGQEEKLPQDWKIYQNDRAFHAELIPDLDELPYIYDDLTPFQNRILYYEASRGCPFHCAYCLSAAEHGVRELPLERVLRELADLESRRVPQIKFVDRTFNCHPSRAAKILQWIRQLPSSSRTNFHFEVEADLLSEELVDIMVQMPKGRIQLEIGIQSTNPETLRSCGRTERLDRVFKNIKRLVEAGNSNIHVDLIAGLPYEDYTRFGQSFDDVYRMGAHQFQLGFLKLLTGAPMNQMIGIYGYTFSQHPPYEILSNQFLSSEDLYRLKCIEDVLERLYNSGRFGRFLSLLVTHYAGPFAMMSEIAEVLRQKGLIFTAMGLTELFDEMAQFSERFEDQEKLKQALLLDHYAATPSDRLPSALKEWAQLPGHLQQESSRREQKLETAGLLRAIGRRERKMMIRYYAGKAVAVDYTERDPVTGQFEVLDDLQQLL